MKRLIDDYPDAVFYASGHKFRYPDNHEMNMVIPCLRGYDSYFRISVDYKGSGVLTSWIIYDKEVLLQVGLFKTDFLVGEDADLATRMALHGKFAYEPKSLGTYMADLPETLSKKNGFYMPIPGDGELLSAEQTQELITYHEYWIQRIAQDNILRGYPKIGRSQLKRIKYNYKFRKILLMTLSYLPTNIVCYLKYTYNKYIWKRFGQLDRA